MANRKINFTLIDIMKDAYIQIYVKKKKNKKQYFIYLMIIFLLY